VLVLAVQVDQLAPISPSSETVAAAPFIQTRPRPAAEISRRRISRPSSGSMPCRRAVPAPRLLPLTSNTPSTSARSAPVRTTSADARSPSSSDSAPTMMDLPAHRSRP
jgi:hypothetical protein